MITKTVLLVLLFMEAGFLVWDLKKKKKHNRERMR